MADTFNYAEQPTFLERLGVLAGKTTYRVPMEGRSSKVKAVPYEHSVAMALAYARTGIDDIGPDIAYDLATASTRHQAKIIKVIAEAIKKDRRNSRLVKRNLPWINLSCHAAYCHIHQLSFSPHAPHDMRKDDWEILVEASRRIMLSMAESAIQRAEDAFYRRGIASSEKLCNT